MTFVNHNSGDVGPELAGVQQIPTSLAGKQGFGVTKDNGILPLTHIVKGWMITCNIFIIKLFIALPWCWLFNSKLVPLTDRARSAIDLKLVSLY